ncbi:ATP-binding protein [Bacillus sp. Marseille-P3800]|uniref:ATP-binding protein n=1 Tax=Bacillus sp. Marseille-P3800 TaxID=2014782 RepID=UPI000C08A69F|nr:ATP-binding protein [Bacillus sp. Marseille-P3800]
MNRIDASPTKSFFVEMLTRDIELEDSIMDLIDNCVDGVLRTIKNIQDSDQEKPYANFYANLTINENEFTIKDNCGGIPNDVAMNSAFRMGKVNYYEQDQDLATVGFYGIGMKRAVFKMGEDINITSTNSENTFCVNISEEWLRNSEWDLQMQELNTGLRSLGTHISVKKLHNNIKQHFENQSFINRLIHNLEKYYAFIINKGFSISVNNIDVKPYNTSLIIGDVNQETNIAPYIYKGKIKDVDVLLQVGIYRSIPNEDELSKEDRYNRSTSLSGWTIICNDRVVVYNDKSMKTGWGEHPVPSYHNQYIGIAGVVIMTSPTPNNLPLTTTKRGVDSSSEVYMIVKNYMRIGTKIFTDHTNRWKKQISDEKELISKLESKQIDKIASSIPIDKWKTSNNKKAIESEGTFFMPKLPRPSTINNVKSIRYSVNKFDFERLSMHMFNMPNYNASDLGSKLFYDAIQLLNEEE